MTSENHTVPRIMVVGTGSGCGKTTLTCGLIKALKNRGLNVASFKCGPDYIDPMFHREAIGAPSYNLDLYLCGEQVVKYLLVKNSAGMDFSVIEGVMGMYDGLADEDTYSSNHISKVTNTPEILVVNTKGKSLSAVAEIYGFMQFKPNNIKGVILNQTTPMMFPFYKDMIEKQLAVKVYGYLPPVADAVFHSRNLGLITPAEVEDIQFKLEKLERNCTQTIDIDGLIQLGQSHSSLTTQYSPPTPEHAHNSVTIAVASDKAFCFYYADNIKLLEELGAKIVYFSPINDEHIPENIDGLMLGGGYPELFAKQISENATMLTSVRQAIQNGLPTIAECGGAIFLCESITDKQGNIYPMVGVINSNAQMGDKLVRFGYTQLTAKKDNMLCLKGETIPAHEFHQSDMTDCGNSFTSQKANGKRWECIHTTPTLFAGFPHIHLWGNTTFAKRFIQQCYRFMTKKQEATNEDSTNKSS